MYFAPDDRYVPRSLHAAYRSREASRAAPGSVLSRSWRAELEVACALAVAAYERVRDDGPSVVPEEEG